MKVLLLAAGAAMLAGCVADPATSARLNNLGAAMVAASYQQPAYTPPPVYQTMYPQPQPVYIAPTPGQQLNTYIRNAGY